MLKLPLSEHVHLRLLEEQDAGELARLVDANREYLARWLPWAATSTEGGSTLEFIRSTRRQPDHVRRLGLHRMVLQAAVENARSRAIPERLGFQSEGVLRQSEKVGERRYDIVLYSMLAPDWQAVGRPAPAASA